MVSARRFGLENSKTRAILVDAAEQLMREEGYAAVTSRRVASMAGLKPQLVHYYFRTMDDLFLAVLRRGTEQNLAHQTRVLNLSQPLRALWEMSSDPAGTALMAEFVALSNHRKEIRAEIARHGEQLRSAQVEVLSRALADYGVSPEVCPPIVMSVLMVSISRVLVLETALGMSAGHTETLALVEQYLNKFEGSRKT